MAREPLALADVRVVRSHPMGLEQCRNLIASLNTVETIAASTTAAAAAQVAASTAPGEAAISSERAAEHYGLHVIADDGHVRIHAGEAGRVQAHIEFDLKRWGLVIGSGEPNIVFERKGDQIWITAHSPRNIGVIGGMDERLTVDVTVPQQTILSVRNGDGSVDCEPLEGRFSFVTGDGAVRAHGLRGDVDVSTGDGRVILDDIDLTF